MSVHCLHNSACLHNSKDQSKHMLLRSTCHGNFEGLLINIKNVIAALCKLHYFTTARLVCQDDLRL